MFLSLPKLGIKVQILNFGLSRIITITPLYILKNGTTVNTLVYKTIAIHCTSLQHSVVVQEVGQNDTITLAPKTVNTLCKEYYCYFMWCTLDRAILASEYTVLQVNHQY